MKKNKFIFIYIMSNTRHRKKNTTNNSTRKLKCAPKQKNKVDNSLQHLSCYSNNFLFKIRNLYNKNNPNNKILSNDPKIIWKLLKKYNSNCKDELCWIEKAPLLYNQRNNIFRPKSPSIWKKNPYAWLSSSDIIKVMNQYESKYSEFKFLGPSPIDYDTKKSYGNCVWETLCKFNIKKYLKDGKNKIGIIFNLDPHYKGGSHWVSIFIDIENKFIFFFDSNGDGPKKQIRKFINNVIRDSNLLNIELKLYTNKGKIHQKKDGQCGIYSLYVIIKLLRGEKTPIDLKNIRITDEEMRDYRKIYFN